MFPEAINECRWFDAFLICLSSLGEYTCGRRASFCLTFPKESLLFFKVTSIKYCQSALFFCRLSCDVLLLGSAPSEGGAEGGCSWEKDACLFLKRFGCGAECGFCLSAVPLRVTVYWTSSSNWKGEAGRISVLLRTAPGIFPLDVVRYFLPSLTPRHKAQMHSGISSFLLAMMSPL